MDGCNLQSPGQKSIYSYSREWERSHNGLWIMDARGWHFLRQYTTGNRDLPMGHGQTQTVLYLKSTAPALWSNIAMRVPTEHNKSGDLYHAEDTAMFFYEEQRKDVPPGERYGPRATMTSYGRCFAEEEARFQPPYSSLNRENTIHPTCEYTLFHMFIRFII